MHFFLEQKKKSGKRAIQIDFGEGRSML